MRIVQNTGHFLRGLGESTHGAVSGMLFKNPHDLTGPENAGRKIIHETALAHPGSNTDLINNVNHGLAHNKVGLRESTAHELSRVMKHTPSEHPHLDDAYNADRLADKNFVHTRMMETGIFSREVHHYLGQGEPRTAGRNAAGVVLNGSAAVAGDISLRIAKHMSPFEH